MNYFIEYPLVCFGAFSALSFMTAFVYDKISRFSIREVLTTIARDVGALDRKIYEIKTKTHDNLESIENRLKSLEERPVPSSIEKRLKVLETFGLKGKKNPKAKS